MSCPYVRDRSGARRSLSIRTEPAAGRAHSPFALSLSKCSPASRRSNLPPFALSLSKCGPATRRSDLPPFALSPSKCSPATKRQSPSASRSLSREHTPSVRTEPVEVQSSYQTAVALCLTEPVAVRAHPPFALSLSKCGPATRRSDLPPFALSLSKCERTWAAVTDAP